MGKWVIGVRLKMMGFVLAEGNGVGKILEYRNNGSWGLKSFRDETEEVFTQAETVPIEEKPSQTACYSDINSLTASQSAQRERIKAEIRSAI